MMRTFLLLGVVVQTVLCGQFSVRMPYENPAGVTYINGPAPAGLAAGPLHYAAPVAAPVHAPLAYAHAPAPLAYAQHSYAAPAYAAHAYAAPAYAAHAYAAPAYAHAKIPTVHAVPTVHHVPGVADVPYTRVVAQPGVVQKLVDVAKPAVSTRKFQLRRPAIQKQFYDIEERVIVRNAGSALLELDEPTSKVQKGPAVVQPVVAPTFYHQPAVAVHQPAFAYHQYAHALPVAPVAPVQPIAPVAPAAPQQPAPQAPEAPVAPADAQDDSVVVENIEARSRAGVSPVQQRFNDQRQMLDAQQEELSARQAQLAQEIQQEMQYQAQRAQAQPEQRQFNPQQQQTEARQQPEQARLAPQPLTRVAPQPQTLPQPIFRNAVDVRSNGAAPLDLIPQPRAGADVIPSLRNSPEVSQANQQRLIQLLTAQGAVAEVGFGRTGAPAPAVGDAGNVRARVLSATPAPERAEPAGERVSTRRVVVSRPIETLQEIDVVEPVTKVHRIAVNQPTVFKTLQHEIARVPTSVPVYGKTLHHSYTHAAVPLQYYHH